MIDANPDIESRAFNLPARYRAMPDTGEVVPSFLLGESGVLLTAARAEARKDWLDALHASIAGNTENPTLEALWGAPGTMIAAVLAHELEPHARWRSVYGAGAAALRRTWLRHDGVSSRPTRTWPPVRIWALGRLRFSTPSTVRRALDPGLR